MAVIESDVHDLPQKDNAFDCVVDTFGLECCYDPKQALKEMKRVCKPGGHILLLERGYGFWAWYNYKMLRMAAHSLGMRGQVYIYEYDKMIAQEGGLRVVEE